MQHTIDERAITFLNTLFQEHHNQFSIRLYLTDPGSVSAKVALELEPQDQLQANAALDHLPVGQGFLFFQQDQAPFVEGLIIGYRATLTGGELEIDLPRLYGEKNDTPLIERIRIFFQKEIQPALDAHRGHALVKDLTPENDLVIAFAGGCQGCSMASLTLKNIIDEKIRQYFPQIRNIIDSTNHAAGDKPYA